MWLGVFRSETNQVEDGDGQPSYGENALSVDMVLGNKSSHRFRVKYVTLAPLRIFFVGLVKVQHSIYSELFYGYACSGTIYNCANMQQSESRQGCKQEICEPKGSAHAIRLTEKFSCPVEVTEHELDCNAVEGDEPNR